MISDRRIVTPIIIVIVSIIINVFCRDITGIYSSQRVLNSSVWGLPKTTTPWPALGSIRSNNHIQQPTWVRPNSNNNNNNNNYNNDNNNRQISQTVINRTIGSSNQPVNANSNVTDDELRQFSEILLTKDQNNAARYIIVNYQGRTTSRSEKDEAPLPLLTINQETYQIPTISKMTQLYDNYIVFTNTTENYLPQERIEENNLLDAVIQTPVMQFTRDFLMQKGKLGQNPLELKDKLREIWFNMYARGGRRVGSSGFEHVFLAEIRNSQVSGLHNWLYFNQEEQQNHANYLGYLKTIDLGNKGAILKHHFKFYGIDKPVGSMFIGTSPELEMALYTTCFLLRADHICPLKMNGKRFIIRTYTYRYRGKNMIGSAFPEI